jgi:hypothetical protein
MGKFSRESLPVIFAKSGIIDHDYSVVRKTLNYLSEYRSKRGKKSLKGQKGAASERGRGGKISRKGQVDGLSCR